ncbi:MAG: MBL fold metallo-hydrolase, partial [Desulfobacteraceae bacterium]|nr:MBL fold metallo-hydrolase [Desulfobacteraceae bacterium]
MYIKCWGSRGSIPVSGKVYKKYGGDTSCLEIVAKSGETIIVDAGTGMRQLGNSLLKRNIREYTILFTHAHWDHILGVAYFKPLQYSKTIAHIQDRMFAGMSTQDVINEVMKCPFFPIKFRELNADMKFEKGLTDQFAIGSIQIETIPTSHPGCGYGYKFTEDNKTFVFLTDNELGYDHPGGCKIDAYVNFSKDADLLIHDAEYTPEEHLRKTGWGVIDVEGSRISHIANGIVHSDNKCSLAERLVQLYDGLT